jgi:hypothetical protein
VRKSAKNGRTAENADAQGRIKVTSNYVLKSVGNGVAEISVTGGIPKKVNKENQGDVTHSLSSGTYKTERLSLTRIQDGSKTRIFL